VMALAMLAEETTRGYGNFILMIGLCFLAVIYHYFSD
jgi:cbb3-type cytochrome oxidase subunit 3